MVLPFIYSLKFIVLLSCVGYASGSSSTACRACSRPHRVYPVNDTCASKSFAVGFAGESSFARFSSLRPSANFHSVKKRTQPSAACASANAGAIATAFSASLARFRPCGLALAAKIPDQRPRFGTFCVSQGIIGIEPDRLIEVTHGFAVVFEVTALKIEMALEVSVVCFHALRRSRLGRATHPLQAGLLSVTKPPLQRFPAARRRCLSVRDRMFASTVRFHPRR